MNAHRLMMAAALSLSIEALAAAQVAPWIASLPATRVAATSASHTLRGLSIATGTLTRAAGRAILTWEARATLSAIAPTGGAPCWSRATCRRRPPRS